MADLSPYEDQTVTVDILVDGTVVATFEVTPDCVAPQASPRVSVAGQVCPPPSATVTLANDGDPASTVVYVIRVNGRVVQESAPIYGGDETTIVGDLSRFEDQRVTVSISANGELLGRRTFRVDCVQESGTGPVTGGGPAGTVSGSTTSGPGVLPSVGADVSPGLVAFGLGLLGAGSLLLLAGAVASGHGAHAPSPMHDVGVRSSTPDPLDFRAVRHAYDTVAEDYAGRLPDTRAESPLDLAMVDAFASAVTAGGSARVLDAGSGTGRMSRYLADRGCLVSGVDLSPGMVAMARRDHADLAFTVGSLADLPYTDDQFAGVMLWYSIIHTPPAGQARLFTEAARVLRPGGHLLVGFQSGEGSATCRRRTAVRARG